MDSMADGAEPRVTATPAQIFNKWIDEMTKELENVPLLARNMGIYKVPRRLRAGEKEDPYSPRIVSIGQLYHDTEDLKGMNAHKLHYTISLLGRAEKRSLKEILGVCARTVLDFVEINRAYRRDQELGRRTKYMDLAKIFLIDGCFILELFYRFYFSDDSELKDDPIFTSFSMLDELRRDLALMENQIPFAVLELLSVHIWGGIDPSVPELALGFFRKSSSMITPERIRTASGQGGNHLLHLIHNCCSPTFPALYDSSTTDGHIEPATILKEVGIKFMPEKSRNLLDLMFQNGIFTIPEIVINEFTDSMLRNLIAFEQCSDNATRYVTSYVKLMDRLLRSPKDVELLERKEIIKNDLGHSEAVLDFFNNLCKNIVCEKTSFGGLCQQVRAHYRRKFWHRYWGELKRDYLKNPWKFISLVAAILLLGLTTVQTYYTVRGYYPH